MPKLSRKASKKARQARMQEELHKFKRGKLHSGSKRGPIVKDRAQAIAIGLSESGQSRRGKRGKRGKRGRMRRGARGARFSRGRR